MFEGKHGDLAVVEHFLGLAFAEEALEPAVFFGEHNDHIHIIFTNKFVDGFLYVFVVDVVEAVWDVLEHSVKHLNFVGGIRGIISVMMIDIEDMNFGIEQFGKHFDGEQGC